MVIACGLVFLMPTVNAIGSPTLKDGFSVERDNLICADEDLGLADVWCAGKKTITLQERETERMKSLRRAAIRVGFAGTIVASAALEAGCKDIAFMAFLMSPPTCRSYFKSPSGRKKIRVDEDCLGHSCGSYAHLEGLLFDTSLGELDVGDAEACVFTKNDSRDGPVLKWSVDESLVEWRTETRHGTKSGTLRIP